MLMLTMALSLILLAKYHPRYKAQVIPLLGIPLAFSYISRPTNSIPIIFLTLFIALRYRKYFLRYCLWSLVVVLPFVLVNVSVYHKILPPYYTLKKVSASPYYLEALAGTLISPSRGLFIYSPIFLFSLYGVFLKIKRRQIEILDLCIIVIICLHWLVISSHRHWWGGNSYGPRYFADMIPFFLYFLIPPLLEFSRSREGRNVIMVILFCSCVALSFVIHYRGATSEDVYRWNLVPKDINKAPSRNWDWRDVQFLRGIL
jgi:hypothetical protein